MDVTPCRDKWAGTMSDRERFNRQMHYQSVDRCFNMEFGYWQENYDQWPIFVDNGIKHEGDANTFLNFDRLSSVDIHSWLHPAFERKVVSETATHQTIQNHDGLWAEIPKDAHSTIPHYTKASVITPDDWQKVKEEKMLLDDPARVIAVDQLKERHPSTRDYPLGINCGSMIGRIRNILTFEGLAYACFDYPDMVEDMVETCCQLVEHGLDQVLPQLDFDFASGWEDICFKNGPIVSLDFFNSVVVPRYERIGKKLHAAGIDLWYTDCDGDVRPLLPGFLKAGINCMFPYEVNCCVHPGELLDQYEGELRIMGGFDKLQMIKGRAAITAYMETLVPYVERGGYIPFCDHRCPPDVDPDDYLFYLDLKEKMFGMGSCCAIGRE